ncbi:MAG: sigma-54-dependent Fis family transcriptional regulator, partial [Acidimicrobiia bacterium]|nr:sigma-54-dependent Fis family transcriptional regulator [Acidimicrobiia bacterium]
MPDLLALVVDDDPALLGLLGRVALQAGFEVRSCTSGHDALRFLRSRKAQVAFVDVNMPGIGGIDVLRAIRATDPECQVVVMSGASGVATAVEAIKLGAVDFLTKPFDLNRLRATLHGARGEIERRRRVLEQERRLVQDLEFCGMIARSAVMEEVFGLIRRAAPHARTALITGETGTGKELAARALHAVGPRADRPFVTVNCSAVVETLFESELFGHRRGSFTGALENKAGLFEQADGGTLFLDEIGELPLSVQAKLLRVLETGEIRRVGELTPQQVDVWIVAATNRSLGEEITGGRFRSDLFFRLNLVEVRLPPLRERREDIPVLAAAFIRETSERLDKRIVGTTVGAERVLVAAPWEGNVRELRNVLERACILTDSEFVTERELSRGAQPVPVAALAGAAVQGAAPASPPGEGAESLLAFERTHVQRVL